MRVTGEEERTHQSENAQVFPHKMKPVPRIFLATVTVSLSLVLLSACSASEAPKPTQTSTTKTTTPSEPAPKLIAGGSAADNEKYFNYTLRKAIRDGMKVTGENVVNTLVNAGFDKLAMQVSFDESRTGLEADNIFVSVRVIDQCLIGQVVTADKTVTTAVEPSVGPDKTYCLIGETRPIDW